MRAKFNGISVRRFTQNAYMYMRIGVFHQNAGMRAPEWAVFFCSVRARLVVENVDLEMVIES